MWGTKTVKLFLAVSLFCFCLADAMDGRCFERYAGLHCPQQLYQPLLSGDYISFSDCYVPYTIVDDVFVDATCQMSEQERLYISRRLVYTQGKLEQLLGCKIQVPPFIAICGSGGGYRAMIGMTGFMQAMEKILDQNGVRFIDVTSYISGVSGSVWFLGPWLVRHARGAIQDTNQYHDILQKQIVGKRFFDIDTLHIQKILKKLFDKIEHGIPLTPVDVWGALLADRLYGDISDAQDITFDCIGKMYLGLDVMLPFPIFNTAVALDTARVGRDIVPECYEELAVNPFSAECWYLSGAVPTMAFGSCFKAGRNNGNLWPDGSIGWYMGIAGSPYSLSAGDVLIFLGQLFNNDTINAIIQKMVSDENLTKKRFLSSYLNNFVYGMAGHPLAADKKVVVTDGGFLSNLGVVPVLERLKSLQALGMTYGGIIFICDCSSDAEGKDWPEMRYAKDCAERKKLPFPSIENRIQISSNVTIFQDPSPDVPMVIYFSNSIPEGTLKFDYSQKEFDVLCDTMKELVGNNRNEIVEAIHAYLNHAKFIPSQQGGCDCCVIL